MPVLALVLMLLAAGCQGPDQVQRVILAEHGAAVQTVTVYAAASLTDAFGAIEKTFEDVHPQVDVVLNLAGSQQLAQQLSLGAPGDVFASANQQQMQAVIEAGRVAPAAPQVFVRNRLVAIVPADNPAGVERLQDLAKPGLCLVLAAEEVPVGRYTHVFLDRATRDDRFGSGYKQHVLRNVASYEQNVRAVLTKVALGEADAGIVYASDLTGSSAEAVLRIEIPDALNTVAAYPMAPLRDRARPEWASLFIDFVLSPAGQEILARYGFIPTHAS